MASLASVRVCLAVSKFASCTHAGDKNWAKSSMEVEVQVGVEFRPPESLLPGQLAREPVSWNQDRSAQQPKKVGSQAVSVRGSPFPPTHSLRRCSRYW